MNDTSDICSECPVHAAKFTVKEWVTFLKTRCKEPHDDPILIEHKAAVDKISNGHGLYDSSNKEIADLLKTIKKNWFILAHITQPTERAIQETSICSSNRKGEDNTSSLVMFCSTEVFSAFDHFFSFRETVTSCKKH